MAQLWNELTVQSSGPRVLSDAVPDIEVAQNVNDRYAVLCPVNAQHDFAAARNAALFKERCESAWKFTDVIVEPDARSSSAKPSAAIVSVLNPVIELLLHGPGGANNNNNDNSQQQHQNKIDVLIIYITCSTAVDVAEIYDNLASIILSAPFHHHHGTATKSMIIVDSPCVAPLQVAPGAELPIPLLVPKPDFDGHIALKFLHAAHDCGDEGVPVTLDAVASRITPIASLLGNDPEICRAAWNPVAVLSSQPVTFLTCSSVEPMSELSLKQIDGRQVGKALKQMMPGARVRYLIEKDQSLVLHFIGEDTGRPPQLYLSHDDCAPEFEAAMKGAGVTGGMLGVVMPTVDRRVHASTPQSELGICYEAVRAQTIKMSVPRLPQRTFLCTNMALCFKYEITTSYRSYLLLEALVRLRVPSSEHRLRIEDLTPPVAAASNVDASSVPPFLFIRAPMLSNASPQRRAIASAINDPNSPLHLSKQGSPSAAAAAAAAGGGGSGENGSPLGSVADMNVSVATQLQQNQSPEQIKVKQQQIAQQAAQAVITSEQTQELVRQTIQSELAQQVQQRGGAIQAHQHHHIVEVVNKAVEENNQAVSQQMSRNIDELRREFYDALRKSTESLGSDIRDTEARWKKHLLLIESRLQNLEDGQEQLMLEVGNSGSSSSSSSSRALGGGGGGGSGHNPASSPMSPQMNVAMRREVSAALEAVAQPLQQLDQKVAMISTRVDTTGERLLALEQIVSSNHKNVTNSQESWMSQRDQQLQKFTSDLTNSLEKRLNHFVPEGRMRVVEERLEQGAGGGGGRVGGGESSPSRAMTERMGAIENLAQQSRQDCQSLEQKLHMIEEATKRLIQSAEGSIKSEVSQSVNRFSSDLSQKLVGFLNENIQRINSDVSSLTRSVSQQIDSASNRSQTTTAETELLQASLTRTVGDVRDLRQRVQQVEIGQNNMSNAVEQDKSRLQRVSALEEQVSRLTNFMRSLPSSSSSNSSSSSSSSSTMEPRSNSNNNNNNSLTATAAAASTPSSSSSS